MEGIKQTVREEIKSRGERKGGGEVVIKTVIGRKVPYEREPPVVLVHTNHNIVQTVL